MHAPPATVSPRVGLHRADRLHRAQRLGTDMPPPKGDDALHPHRQPLMPGSVAADPRHASGTCSRSTVSGAAHSSQSLISTSAAPKALLSCCVVPGPSCPQAAARPHHAAACSVNSIVPQPSVIPQSSIVPPSCQSPSSSPPLPSPSSPRRRHRRRRRRRRRRCRRHHRLRQGVHRIDLDLHATCNSVV